MTDTSLYSTIIETTRALIVVLDVEGRIVMFNPACERMTGYRFEEVKGRHVWDFLLLPEELEGVKAVFDDLARGQFRNTYANYWVTKSGEKRWIEWTNSVVTDGNGNAVQIIGTGIDVTERQAAEQAQREAQRRQKALLDGIPDAAWLLDADGRYVAVNRELLKRWNIAPSDIIGKLVLETHTSATKQAVIAENREILRTGKQLRIEKHYVQDGRHQWFDVIKTPIMDDAGNVTGIAGISREITARKLFEVQRIARDAAQRDALLKEVHHRIKNNLQGTITLIQELASGHPESEDLLESAIARLNTIAGVHGLYGATGARELRLEQIIQTLVSSLQGLHGRPPMRLSVNSPLSALVSENEIVPLSLILNELIMNAIKHSRAADNDFVQIALESAGNGARIVIRNRSGKLPRHFNFDTGTGLGTGLALVQSLLPPSGMALRFENTPGRPGTEVELTLCPPVITLLSPAASPSIATREPVHGAHPDRRG